MKVGGGRKEYVRFALLCYVLIRNLSIQLTYISLNMYVSYLIYVAIAPLVSACFRLATIKLRLCLTCYIVRIKFIVM